MAGHYVDAMSIFGNIRLVFSIMVLMGIVAVGGVLTYIEHNDDQAAAIALGSMAVDPEAGKLEQATQLIVGVGAASAAIDDIKRDRVTEEFSHRSDFGENRYGRPVESSSGDESASIPMDSPDSEFAAD
jgi:hypothetical protein